MVDTPLNNAISSSHLTVLIYTLRVVGDEHISIKCSISSAKRHSRRPNIQHATRSPSTSQTQRISKCIRTRAHRKIKEGGPASTTYVRTQHVYVCICMYVSSKRMWNCVRCGSVHHRCKYICHFYGHAFVFICSMLPLPCHNSDTQTNHLFMCFCSRHFMHACILPLLPCA